jgi:hypothetical protein
MLGGAASSDYNYFRAIRMTFFQLLFKKIIRLPTLPVFRMICPEFSSRKVIRNGGFQLPRMPRPSAYRRINFRRGDRVIRNGGFQLPRMPRPPACRRINFRRGDRVIRNGNIQTPRMNHPPAYRRMSAQRRHGTFASTVLNCCIV